MDAITKPAHLKDVIKWIQKIVCCVMLGAENTHHLDGVFHKLKGLLNIDCVSGYTILLVYINHLSRPACQNKVFPSQKGHLSSCSIQRSRKEYRVFCSQKILAF